ncbi:hypothetical protein [Bradyrhizobium acaciae]|uniref:hypothetical protein n=1 Tax=Bradyrhizobium acaciae TaxID=2683706 RepID=UPI001E4106AB|nr:hypothetical protein [Bradyrhizobium acaciae]MCC8978659.1 hypothetical protein [Bradyrhizobium acaciae]
MTDEDEFEAIVQQRICEAAKITGYPFLGLRNLVRELGAYGTAKQLIAPTPQNLGRFPKGLRVLFDHGLLRYSIEQTVIEFGQSGRLFAAEDMQHAEDRLALIRAVLRRRPQPSPRR